MEEASNLLETSPFYGKLKRKEYTIILDTLKIIFLRSLLTLTKLIQECFIHTCMYIRSCNVIILWDTFLFIIYWRTKKLKEVLTLLVRLYDSSIIQILLHTYVWRIYAFLIVIQSFLYYESNAAISYLSLYIC